MARSLAWSAFLLLLVAAVPLATSSHDRVAAQHATAIGRRVVVVIDGLRSARGQVLGGLYTNAGSWLRENRADADCVASIRGRRAECVFENVQGTRFAFAGMHDEDEDRELDRDVLGLPSEGYAFSNDAREPFGPPSFQAAAFRGDRLVVHARYGL